nr:unnamed protein product [Callosobruchus analis]
MTTPRANVDVAVVGDRLYAVGGFQEYLDTTTNEWTTFIPKGTCDIPQRRKPRNRRSSRRSISESKRAASNPPAEVAQNDQQAIEAADTE